jgi:hypothetical protein
MASGEILTVAGLHKQLLLNTRIVVAIISITGKFPEKVSISFCNAVYGNHKPVTNKVI